MYLIPKYLQEGSTPNSIYNLILNNGQVHDQVLMAIPTILGISNPRTLKLDLILELALNPKTY
jgi:hypothetical protein